LWKLFLRLLSPGAAGMGMRRRFLAVGLFAVQLGRHGLKILTRE